MRKTSLLLGLLLSAVLHGLIFFPALFDERSAKTMTERAADEGGKLTVMRPPAPEASELAAPPSTPQESLRSPASTPAERQYVKELERVVETPASTADSQSRGDMGTEADPEGLPPMRILWSGPEELRAVARSFGMKVVALDAAGNMLGQLSLGGTVSLERFDGSLRGFSNRVRTLPREFFGQHLLSGEGQEIEAFWVLVPAQVDVRFSQLQKEAIQGNGFECSQVAAVEARFAVDAPNGYALVITDVIPLGRKGVDHG